METSYIQFDNPNTEDQTRSDGFLKRIFINLIVGILKIFIPKSNPDFEKEIDKVKSWLIEIDNETGIPEREIGLDENGNTILKMPYKVNRGYWTDNNLLLEDFKRLFNVSEIDKSGFETRWKNFNF